MKNKGLQHVFEYFAFFEYAPTLDQIHRFYPHIITRQRLLVLLNREAQHKMVVASHGRYALAAQKRYLLASHKRFHIALEKSKIVKKYVRVLSIISCIQMVALSGSIAVGSAKDTDDIDLFLVTKSGFLWTSRFLAVVLAYVMGLKRRRGVIHAPNKVCLNLLFDESDLMVPKYKRNLYTAHEVLQAVPVVNKNNTYEQFIAKNTWVALFFPNTVLPAVKRKQKKIKKHQGVIEKTLKHIQLWFMNPHRTTEIITDTQLWFLPRDMQEQVISQGRATTSQLRGR